MRKFILIVENAQSIPEGFGKFGRSFEEIAKESPTYDDFLDATDGFDVLYRGHAGGETQNNSFMTDYVGHAREYAGGRGEGEVDAFSYNPSDVVLFNDSRFDEMRRAYRYLEDDELAALYQDALKGNRHADEFSESLRLVKIVLRRSTPYSKFSAHFPVNDAMIPLMQKFARDKYGKNIIAFHGGDYADVGGQTEYVVGDVSKLRDLRKLYYSVHQH